MNFEDRGEGRFSMNALTTMSWEEAARQEADDIILSAGITEGKKALRRVLREIPMSPENIVMIHRYLTRFDQQYLTPEADTAGA